MSEIKVNGAQHLPTRSDLLAWTRLVELTCVEPATVAELLRTLPGTARIAVLPQGPLTIPYLAG